MSTPLPSQPLAQRRPQPNEIRPDLLMAQPSAESVSASAEPMPAIAVNAQPSLEHSVSRVQDQAVAQAMILESPVIPSPTTINSEDHLVQLDDAVRGDSLGRLEELMARGSESAGE